MTAQGLLVYGTTGLATVAPPALYGVGAPTKPGILGQEYFDTSTSPRTAYVWSGAEWLTDASTASVQSVTGTANQILATPTTGNVVVSLIGPYTPATYTAHGVLIGEGTGSIVATTPGTTGQVLIGATGADPAFGALGVNSGLTAHGVLIGEGNSAIAATAVGSTGTLLAGNTGADPSFTSSPSVTGSITAGTTLTATLGNITATNGNIVRGTAGNKDVYSSVATTTAAGANSAGTVALAGGTATVSTTAVTASSQIRLYRQGIGATGAAALGILTLGTITAGTSFVINAVQAADATALQASDVSVIGWEIVN
jgi:hypothetical protein